MPETGELISYQVACDTISRCVTQEKTNTIFNALQTANETVLESNQTTKNSFNIPNVDINSNFFDDTNNAHQSISNNSNNQQNIHQPTVTQDLRVADMYIDQIVSKYQDLSKYLLKKVSISSFNTSAIIKDVQKYIRDENQNFITNQLYENIDYKDTLSDRQNRLLEKLGPEYFPKTLNPEMCDLICLQTKECTEKIFGKVSGIDYIPIFIPEQYNLHFQVLKHKNKDNILSAETKKNLLKLMEDLQDVKVNYIVVHNIVKDTKAKNYYNKSNQLQYLVTCVNKIKATKEPEIYVFIPDYLLNSEMKIVDTLENKNFRLLFYNCIQEYHEFLFGYYGIFIDLLTNDTRNTKDSSRNYKFDESTIGKFDIIYELEALKQRVEKKILLISQLSKSRINNNYIYSETELKKPTKYTQISKKRLLEDAYKLKTKYQKKDNSAHKNTSLINYLFKVIKKELGNKYSQEIHNQHSYISKLINSGIFHQSSNIYYTEGENYEINKNIIRNIQSCIDKDIIRLNLDKKKHLRLSNYAILLLPLKCYISREDDEENVKFKEQKIQIMPIEQCSYEYLGVMENSSGIFESFEPDDSKIVAAFTSEISANNTLTDDKIIVLLPKAFDLKGKPLYDPNEFLFKAFFYNFVEKQDTNYPLYVFGIHPIFNYIQIFKTKYRPQYSRKMPDIYNSELADYLIDAYKIFHTTVRDHVINLQLLQKAKIKTAR